MSLLRSTDVKKHLGRAVPRFVSPRNEEDLSNGTPIVPSTPRAEIVPIPVTTGVPQKVETA